MKRICSGTAGWILIEIGHREPEHRQAVNRFIPLISEHAPHFILRTQVVTFVVPSVGSPERIQTHIDGPLSTISTRYYDA